MARVIKRVAAKRDLMDHFVFLGDKASVDVARRFLHACNVSFQALAHMPELGTQRSFRNPRFSSVRAWPVKGFERYLLCCGFPDSAGSGFQSACLREAIFATQ